MVNKAAPVISGMIQFFPSYIRRKRRDDSSPYERGFQEEGVFYRFLEKPWEIVEFYLAPHWSGHTTNEFMEEVNEDLLWLTDGERSTLFLVGKSLNETIEELSNGRRVDQFGRVYPIETLGRAIRIRRAFKAHSVDIPEGSLYEYLKSIKPKRKFVY